MDVRVGTSGWSYPGWLRRFYPAGLLFGEWLAYYADRFSTVEVNMTFYRWPKPAVLKSWVENTPAGFAFSLKANREITHIKRLKKAGREVAFFYRLARSLGGKLGCILFQLPPSLARDDGLLKDFLSVLSPEFCNVIEFRHSSWYSEKVYSLLRSYRTSFCVVSSSKVPPVVVLTSTTAYFRFHGLTGGYRYEYSEPELREWAGRIKSLAAPETFVFFNNDYQARAVTNAVRLKELLA